MTGRRSSERIGHAIASNIPALIMATVVGLLVIPPLVTVIWSSFAPGERAFEGDRTLENYETVLSDSSGYRIIYNTFVFAAGSALLSVFFAAAVALLVERTNTPFRRLVYIAVVVAFAVPTVIQTMGWIMLLGPTGSLVNGSLHDALGGILPVINLYSMPGMIFVQATVLFPALFLLISPTFRAADPALEHAASVSGAGRLRVVRSVTLPLAVPSLLAAGLLGFIVGIESFEVPALIGTPSKIRVLSTAIFSRVQGFEPDYGAAAAFSCLLMLLTVGGVFLYQRATARAHRFATVTGKGYRPDKIDLGGYRFVTAIVTFVISVVILAPLFILLWASLLPFYAAPALSQIGDFSLDNYSKLLDSEGFLSALKNSLLLGISSALIVMSLTLVIAWTIVRRRNALSRGLDFVTALPLVVPGVVLSLAVLQTYINLPVGIYGSIWILLIAFVIHYLPYGQRYSHAGIISLHQELEEAAEVSGASRLRIFVSVVVPLMRPALVAGGLFVFLATVRQLSVVIFLTSPTTNVVSTEIFALWNIGSFTDAATASMIVIVVVLALGGLIYAISGLGNRGGLSAIFGERR